MNSPTPFELDVTHGKSQATVFTVRGELDMTTAARLRDQALPAIEHGTTVLDMAGITFCDSYGLRTLTELHLAARFHGAVLRLAAVNEAVMRILDLTGMAEHFELYPNVDAALKA